MPQVNTKPISQKPTLADDAYTAVKRKILSLELTPGSQFSEAQLSSLLSMGKTPMREALARLQREDLVEVIPRSCYRVTPVTLKDARDIFALRVLLEGEAVRLASGKEYTEHNLRRLEELCHIEYVVEDHELFTQAISDNTEFHVLLAQGSGNPRLVALLRQVMEHFERILHIAISLTPSNGIDYQEHPDLLRAILGGDGERAREIVLAQNRTWQDRMIDILLSSEALLSTNIGAASLPLAVVEPRKYG